MEVERNLNEAAAMQSGLTAEERQQHLAEVEELKTEIASQVAATARLRASLEERSNVIERLTANDVQQQQKINSLKVRAVNALCCLNHTWGSDACMLCLMYVLRVTKLLSDVLCHMCDDTSIFQAIQPYIALVFCCV